MRRVILVCALMLSVSGIRSPVSAQCPDGSPPPCAGRRASAAPAPLDLNRIAVLPFRVATADSLLGEGIAELVASEFTGESGLHAVHMGSVLSAWRRAGGGLRSPLPQPGALRLARGMGAGLFVDGSVVGVGNRLTISATVVRSSDGSVRRASPVSGSADSLDALTNRVVVGVMAAAGGEARAEERSRTTSSPAAMRAYLEGLAAFRRGDLPPAIVAFERALEIDSTFAQAAVRRLEIAIWKQDAEVQPRWGPLAWSFRDHLSRADRAVLESFLGPRFPARTPATEWLAAADRATREAPESPDAWYQYGDLLFHGGGVAEADPMTHALALFQRAFALDSQETVLEHLVEGAMLTGDSALLRRLNPAALMETSTVHTWFAAAQLNDVRLLQALRRREAPWTGFAVMGGLFGASRATVDELISMLTARRHEQRAGFFLTLVSQGRPQAALAFVQSRAPDPTIGRDVGLVTAGAWAGGDAAAARDALARLVARTPASDREAASINCVRAQWAFANGLPVDLDEDVVRRGGGSLCAMMVGLMKAALANAPDMAARLTSADSAVREAVFNIEASGFEGLVLSRLWAARGNYGRALAAIRLRVEGTAPDYGTIAGVVEEGPLALQAGDTTGAIRAYRRLLRMRPDPEPPLIPQRDSARAVLARLEHR